jgi:hypothetical protein
MAPSAEPGMAIERGHDTALWAHAEGTGSFTAARITWFHRCGGAPKIGEKEVGSAAGDYIQSQAPRKPNAGPRKLPGRLRSGSKIQRYGAVAATADIISTCRYLS